MKWFDSTNPTVLLIQYVSEKWRGRYHKQFTSITNNKRRGFPSKEPPSQTRFYALLKNSSGMPLLIAYTLSKGVPLILLSVEKNKLHRAGSREQGSCSSRPGTDVCSAHPIPLLNRDRKISLKCRISCMSGITGRTHVS